MFARVPAQGRCTATKSDLGQPTIGFIVYIFIVLLQHILKACGSSIILQIQALASYGHLLYQSEKVH